MTPDPLTAALDQLAACHDELTQLDAREADHYTAITTRLADLAAQLTRPPDGDDSAGYRPVLPPPWWKLAAPDRAEPVARLRGWVEQVYQPGYGHLAATLGPCWPVHDLCLYGLDILAGLWSALYLQPRRTAGMLSAQAEYQARILPALAAQLMTETSSCGHARHRIHGPGQPRSTP
jgi:hypothetical protein